MVDTKTPGDKTLSVPSKTLTLKPRVETGTVRQSFSHGRTKQVVVEKRGKRRVSREGIEQAEREAAEARRKAEEDRHRVEEEAKRKAELEAKRRFGETETTKAATVARAAAAVPAVRAPGVAADATDEDEGPRQVRRGPGGAVRAAHVIRLLMKQGAMHKITDVIDADTAQLIAEEMGHSVKRVAASDVEEGLFDVVDDSTDTEPRSPVVTVMGHVDHGKTSLLDALRHANVVSGEAGGITQHIGAYQVTSPESGKKITFIDTPGHAAFTAMRARGAKVTDIVILVVAADDGVMPQTVEAINHAKAAKVPMIIAINKIDKPDAKPERVRTELLQHEVQVESLGGEVVDVEVSAKNKTNLDKLLEMIALQAELLDLKTNAARPAEGTVIEAKLDRGRGPVATVLVQRGTLRVGDIVVAGAEMGRVRALISDQGETIEEAGPSVPVEVLGFNGPPEAGDRLAVVENEARARQVTSYRAHQKRENAAASISGMRGSLEQMMSQLKTSC